MMKVSYSIKGWEPIKWSKRDLAKWLKESVMPDRNSLYGYREALEALEFDDIKKYPKPRRAKLTVTYEVEDE